MNKLKISGFGLFLLVSSASFAQTSHDDMSAKKDKTFETWDANKDKKIDKKEFKSTFDKMDSYKEWDTNKNNSLDEDEFKRGVSAHSDKLEDKKIGSFSDWDVNGDKKIDKMEYTDGSFKLWDKDDNNYVDAQEFVACHKTKMK